MDVVYSSRKNALSAWCKRKERRLYGEREEREKHPPRRHIIVDRKRLSVNQQTKKQLYSYVHQEQNQKKNVHELNHDKQKCTRKVSERSSQFGQDGDVDELAVSRK